MADATVSSEIDTFLTGGRLAMPVNGAASAPALSLTGVPFAGTATTSFPLLYINETGATASTTLATAGALLGVNSNGTSDLMNLMKDGISMLRVDFAGILSANGQLTIIQSSTQKAALAPGGVTLQSVGYVSWTSTTNSQGTKDLYMNRLGPANLLLGNVASATPIGQICTIGEASRPGTDSGVKGADGTIQSGLGTGTATGVSSLIFQTPTVNATATAAQTYATRLTLNSAAVVAAVPVRLPAYTVGTLPAGTIGDMAYVTDATAPTYLGALTGGGAVKCPVFYNGTAWVSH